MELLSFYRERPYVLSHGAFNLERTCEAFIEKYGDAGIPTSASHGDLHAANMFYDKGAISVIDWELSKDRDWSFYDFWNYAIPVLQQN